VNVIISGPYPYVDNLVWGGVESVIKNIEKGFSEGNYDNVSLKIFSGTKKAIKDYENYNNIIYLKQSNFRLGSVFLSKYPFLIKKILKDTNFDILNAHSIDFGYYGLDYVDRLLFTLHGMSWEESKFMSWQHRIGWNLFYVKRLNKILKHIKYFVSINPYSRKSVEERTNARIFDIYNPITDNFFNIENNSLENRMLYIGIISKRKNLLSLIKALNYVKKEINNFRLVVAGKIGDNDYFHEIKNYINKNHLNNYVEILGNISEEEKLKELSKMSFLVLPSLQETAPMVISEAFACGKPVVASNICGIPYMVNDEKNGFLFDPTNEKKIAEKIIYLFENPSEIRNKGISAKSYAIENHLLKKVTMRYLAAYEEIARGL
jgi:glycosyltransferase involved in cell wall biosynthesis